MRGLPACCRKKPLHPAGAKFAAAFAGRGDLLDLGGGEVLGELVDRARAGSARLELATAVPFELVEQIGAVGGAEQIAARVAAYHDAGADHVAIVPSTAEDPAGVRLLDALIQLDPAVTP